MELHLLAVGKLRPAFRALADDYLRRLARVVSVREQEVREAGRAGSVARQRSEEGARLLAAVPSAASVTLLDIEGRRWSSEEVAQALDRWRLASRDHVVIIGGAVGVDSAVRARADSVWSLGPLTLPHELARVVVVEQLYRATTILQGTPYHKGER
ncbi:MAG: 23S rRNA (pseudouridine(1915)-N(3))-methyltransferase RlmH [Gemmatimonadales bacterium]|nr:23S rRNA (pseudouridine(1915)-N(3))-methyltransferase RlmH [Gemmatimonadales bacterium]